MTRQETAINMAIINKESKQIATACKLQNDELLNKVLRNGTNFTALSGSIMAYIKKDRDPALFKQLMHMADTTAIYDYLRAQSKPGIANKLKEIANVIDRLNDFGNEMYMGGTEEFENLIPFFANEQAQELLNRAVEAGLLKKNYQPEETTARFQLKLIALAVMEIMQYQRGDKWCHFEQLWGVEISRRCIPFTKWSAINKVSLLYPEISLLSIIAPKNNELTMKTDLTEPQARRLFKWLVHYGYLGPRTPVESFLAIMGMGDFPFHAVNWIAKSMYSLVYFAKKVYGPFNSNLLKKMCDCFTINGQPLNHGTLKSMSSYVDRNLARFDFVPLLDKIIAKARKQ